MTTPPTTPQARCERCAGRGAIDVWARSMQVPCPDCSSPTAQTIDQSDSKARCEQIAREIAEHPDAKYPGPLRLLIRDALLAAEERGKQEAVIPAPEWLVECMEKLKQSPPSSLEQVKTQMKASAETIEQARQSEPTRECVDTASEIVTRFMVISAGRDVEALESAIAAALQSERDKLASVEESARKVSEISMMAELLNYDPAERDKLKLAEMAACDWQTEHDMLKAHLEAVEESARRVIEQAVHVLATRPITGERHTVLTELEAWLAEHLAPVKPCPEDTDVQRESAEKP